MTELVEKRTHHLFRPDPSSVHDLEMLQQDPAGHGLCILENWVIDCEIVDVVSIRLIDCCDVSWSQARVNVVGMNMMIKSTTNKRRVFVCL
jgi:hypothetical protein